MDTGLTPEMAKIHPLSNEMHVLPTVDKHSLHSCP